MDIFNWCVNHPEITVVGAITLIQVAPIKIDPWKHIAKWFKKCIIGDLDKKIDDLANQVNGIEKKYDERNAINCRTRIQRFGDEVFHGVKHSKEHFEGILIDIDDYEKYCDVHKDFRNNVTVLTTKRIKDIYDKCLQDNSFL